MAYFFKRTIDFLNISFSTFQFKAPLKSFVQSLVQLLTLETVGDLVFILKVEITMITQRKGGLCYF